MKNFGMLWVLLLTISGCSSVKKIAVETDITRTLNQSPIFGSQFTGFSLYDLAEGKFIAGYNDTKKFTPASNVKHLTMYVVLKSFADSIPGLIYSASDDSLWIQPIGDPTFLYDVFNHQPIFKFLKKYHSINIVWPVNNIEHFGAGWAWDDYYYDFQTQRSWWPIYGNRIDIIKKNDSITVSPDFFKEYVEIIRSKRPGDLVKRAIKYNLFKTYIDNDTSDFKRSIPFDYSKELLTQLLTDTLEVAISFSNRLLIDTDTLFTQNLDSVLSVMMKKSDNFLAEQLLILSAWKHGYNSIEPFIRHVKLIWLRELNDFVWVDGSGLSRYNLIAPVDQVRILEKAVEEFGLERIKNILAVGGKSGTIKKQYSSGEPYIYAKTGTLSNNHNLSGLLKTRSEKWMIFAFMNNHFTTPLNDVKKEMEKLLKDIRDTY